MNITSLTAIPLAFGQSLARMFGATSQVRSGFSLSATGAGSLSVTVAAGTAWINGTYLNYAGGTVTPGAAHATLARYDLIVVLDAAIVPSVVAGTAASAPVPPALAAGALFLGYVFIGPAATDYTSSTDAFIADYTMPIVNFAGTAAAPVMAPTGDLDTGWVFPRADAVQQVTGGVARWETTSTGVLQPVSTSTTDLGAATQRWRDIFGMSLSVSVASVGQLIAASASINHLVVTSTASVASLAIGGQGVLGRVSFGNTGSVPAVNWNSGDWQQWDLNENTVSWSFTNPVTGRTYYLEMRQDASGARDPVFPACVEWDNGDTEPTWTTTSLRTDFVVMLWNGAKYIAGARLNYALG